MFEHPAADLPQPPKCPDTHVTSPAEHRSTPETSSSALNLQLLPSKKSWPQASVMLKATCPTFLAEILQFP